MQKSYLHLLKYCLALTLLMVADSLSTDFVIKNNLGFELNNFVDTSSLMTLMFSPLHLIYFLVCCGTIAYAESDQLRTSNQITSKKLILFLHSLPYFFLFVLILAVVNNVSIGFGHDGIISWFVGLFGEWHSFGYLVSMTLLAALVLPACERYVIARY